MAERIHLLTITVNPAGIIQGLTIEETDGATTAFTFSNMQENAPIPASDFTFTPPPHTNVVNGQPPI